MMTKRNALAAACLAVVLGAFGMGCSNTTPNDAPILDSVDAPLVVEEANGNYAIPVTVLFHDNDSEAITHLRFRIAPNVDQFIDLDRPNPTRQSAEVMVKVPASACGKRERAELEISVIDARGFESGVRPHVITLR